MKALARASDVLFVLALVLLVVALVAAVKALLLVAAAVFVGSVALTSAKRRRAKARRVDP